MTQPRNNPESGFTILEFIIYIGLVGMILTVAVLFSLEFAITQSKAELYAEAGRNAQFAMDRIDVEVAEGESIDVGGSTFDVHPGVLSISTANPATDPTVFRVTDGQLTVQQGADAEVALTSPDVEVTEFTITNLIPHARTQVVRVHVRVRLPSSSSYLEVDADVDVDGTFRIRNDNGFSLLDELTLSLYGV